MAEQLANLATSVLASPIDGDDTAVAVAAGTGSRYPATGDFRLTVEQEIMRATSRAGDVITVVRGQEGTAAAPHLSGVKVTHSLTKAGLDAYLNDRIQVSSDGSVTVPDAVETGDRFAISTTMFNPPASATRKGLVVTGTGRGTGTVSERLKAIHGFVQDHASVANVAVTGAANNGSGLVRLTTAAHGLSTGDRVAVYGVVGTVEANGAWTVTAVDATHLDLQGSAFSVAYVSGGTVTNRPMLTGLSAYVAPKVDRGGLTGTALHGDDVAGVAVQNVGTAKGTDAIYVATSPTVTGSAWFSVISLDVAADWAVRLNGTYALGGIDLSGSTLGASPAVLLPNDKPLSARNQAGNATISLIRFNTSNQIQFDTTMRWAEGASLVLGSTTGSMIGSASSQKLGFWGATPIVRPTVTGSRGGNAALASLLTALANAGLVVDSSSA
jgi:hypothetical protein